MKNLIKFENFIVENHEDINESEKKELINKLSNPDIQDIYDRHDLESMNVEQLRSLNSDIEEDYHHHHEETSELEYESKKWIQDDMKRPGSLRRKMHKKMRERISNSQTTQKIMLSEMFSKQLISTPESGMNYHRVDIYLKNGEILKDKIVLNSSILSLEKSIKINSDNIEKLVVSSSIN